MCMIYRLNIGGCYTVYKLKQYTNLIMESNSYYKSDLYALYLYDDDMGLACTNSNNRTEGNIDYGFFILRMGPFY